MTILSYWNDALTILTFGITLVLAYYQIQHYRSQRASVKILDVVDSEYGGRRGDSYRPEGRDDEVSGSFYTVEVLVENDGREPATISDATLTISDTAEELRATNDNEGDTRQHEIVTLSGNDRQRIQYAAHGDVRDEYEEPIEGVLRLDTVTGEEAVEVTFPPR